MGGKIFLRKKLARKSTPPLECKYETRPAIEASPHYV
jgi:hypothetical protein